MEQGPCTLKKTRKADEGRKDMFFRPRQKPGRGRWRGAKRGPSTKTPQSTPAKTMGEVRMNQGGRNRRDWPLDQSQGDVVLTDSIRAEKFPLGGVAGSSCFGEKGKGGKKSTIRTMGSLN